MEGDALGLVLPAPNEKRCSNSMAGSISSRRLQRSARRLGTSSTIAPETEPAMTVEATLAIVDQAGGVEDPRRGLLPQKGGRVTPMELARPIAGQQIAALPAPVYEALTAFDDRLVEALKESIVRLIYIPWLLAQPAGFKMPYRQQLEQLERSGASPSPLVDPEEAVALVRRGDRSVGAVTQYLQWLSTLYM